MSCYILLRKLEYFVIRKTPLKWSGSYFRNRIQSFSFSSDDLGIRQISTRVPQVSIPDPLLFPVHVNDITSASQRVELSLSVVDTKVYDSASSCYACRYTHEYTIPGLSQADGVQVLQRSCMLFCGNVHHLALKLHLLDPDYSMSLTYEH